MLFVGGQEFIAHVDLTENGWFHSVMFPSYLNSFASLFLHGIHDTHTHTKKKKEEEERNQAICVLVRA